MDARYARIRTFKALLAPVSERMRGQRMAEFCRQMCPRPGLRVLDLGGQPSIWETVSEPLDITILNLPGIAQRDVPSHHELRYVEGDACAVEGFSDGQFDLVFSNSVIEHVGPPDRQAAFAHEVRRLGKAYWVQTPAVWFPLEAHSGMPFWWFYPERMRKWYLERWRRKLPAWTQMIEETRVLSLSTMKELFPGAAIYTERFAGIPKSYTAYSKPH